MKDNKIKICLTFDIDKEPLDKVYWLVDLLNIYCLKATFFVSYEKDFHFLKDIGHEIAIMPHIDSISEAGLKILELKDKYPYAVGLRPYGGLHDFRLAPILRENGFVYQSSSFIPSFVQPFRQGNLFNLPVIFQDLAWVTWGLIPKTDIFDLMLKHEGIYTVLFHVGAIHCNAFKPNHVQAIYDENYNDQNKSEWGVADLFKGFVEKYKNKKNTFIKCIEACQILNDMKDIRRYYGDNMHGYY